jgi:hypothetical protein
VDETTKSHLVYEPDDEPEALAVEALLKDAGIVCQLLPHGDTAYPGVTDRHRSWGEIRVAADKIELAQDLIAEYIETLDEGEVLEKAEDVRMPSTTPPPIEHSAPARSALYHAAWPMLLALSVGLNVYLYVEHVYSPFEPVVETKDDRGRVLYRQHFASPRDVWSTRTDEYDVGGDKWASYYDDDADGRIERFELFDDGRLVGGGSDVDGDGTSERVWCETAHERIEVDLERCQELFEQPEG